MSQDFCSRILRTDTGGIGRETVIMLRVPEPGRNPGKAAPAVTFFREMATVRQVLEVRVEELKLCFIALRTRQYESTTTPCMSHVSVTKSTWFTYGIWKQ